MNTSTRELGENKKFRNMKGFEIELIKMVKPSVYDYPEAQFTYALQFWLSCLGSAMGFGNIWRFPYVLYKNGGGVFLIPYFACILFIVFPLYYLETAYGQLYRRPLHKYYSAIKDRFIGLSYAVATVGFFRCVFLTTLLAWGVNLLLFSFQNPLPWEVNSSK